MLATIETDEDTYGLALYYAGLSEPLIWDSSTTLDFIGGTCTITNDGTVYTFNYDNIFVRTQGGTGTGVGRYVYAQIDDNPIISPSTSMLAYARPTVTSGMEFTGTYTANQLLSIADGDITVGTPTLTTDSVDALEELYRVTGLTGTYEVDNETESVTFDSVIVDRQQTATTVEPLPGVDAVLSVIPLILLIGVVLGCVGFIAIKRE